jgi:hypothetical protein
MVALMGSSVVLFAKCYSVILIEVLLTVFLFILIFLSPNQLVCMFVNEIFLTVLFMISPLGQF